MISNEKIHKNYGLSNHRWREICHIWEEKHKEIKRDIDREKSKHTLPRTYNQGHRIWSISAKDSACDHCCNTVTCPTRANLAGSGFMAVCSDMVARESKNEVLQPKST